MSRGHNADVQRKAARAARHKDDPYYLKNQNDDDIEAIPIVRLDDEMEAGREFQLKAILTTASTPTEPKKKKKKARAPTPPPVVIDKTGEMPEGVIAEERKPTTTSRSPANTELAAVDLSGSMQAQTSGTPSRFEEYQVDEEPAPQPPTVGVVKVKRKKKKAVPAS